MDANDDNLLARAKAMVQESHDFLHLNRDRSDKKQIAESRRLIQESLELLRRLTKIIDERNQF